MSRSSFIDLSELGKAAEEIRITVISDAAPHRNGVGAYYQDLEQHLGEFVADMNIICPKIHDGKWSGGLAFPLPGDKTQKFIMPNPFRIWRLMKQQKPDVVIIPTPGLFGIVGAIMAKRWGANVIVGFHTFYEKLSGLYWRSWQRWITLFYFKTSNRILFHYADRIVVNSEIMAEAANSIGGSAIEIVGTPVSYDFIHHRAEEHSGEIKRVIFAGRLAAEKNLESIIEAAQQHPQKEFNIVGDGPQRDEIITAAKQLANLNYIGWSSRDDLLKLIDEHDLLVLPSHVEAFGTIALEAMARCRLVLVSKNCGILDWPELEAGLLQIKPDERLSHALTRINSMDDATRRQLAIEGRERAVTQNAWNLKQWLKLAVKPKSDICMQ
ncbi:MAG: glycosyltransferase [Cellvibrionaceae bacterium]|nr:glycosyltransferase [Cellvibrionaceae bacterium]